ncbi:MAG TPA: hypothetical protein VGL56_20650 [Fimbriimonadaceae bacterium]
MTSKEEHALLADNLGKTYLSIAGGLPSTEFIKSEGWVAAVNPFAHPICNFAICEDCADLDIKELRRLASGRPFFNVYVNHFAEEDGAHETLEEKGLVRLYRLDQMARTREEPAGRPCELAEAFGVQDRKRISDFMCWQFFSTQTPAIRDKISAATLSAPQLKLYETQAVEIRSRPAAAVMLHRTPGVLGLYNLCVAVPLRKRGYGSMVVHAVEILGIQESVIVGLQCDPGLSHWYVGLGLEKVGSVDVYAFKKL